MKKLLLILFLCSIALGALQDRDFYPVEESIFHRAIIDPVFPFGTDEGQFIYWDGSEWTITDVNEFGWDPNTFTVADVNVATGDVDILTGDLFVPDDGTTGTAINFWNYDDTTPKIWTATALVDLGTGELAAGSINRASGTLTLEIGGTAEQSITSTETTFGGNLLIADAGNIGSVSDPDALAIAADGTVTFNSAYAMPIADGSTDDVLKTDGAGTAAWATPTIEVPINISMFDAVPARGTESNWNGGLLSLDTGAAVNSGAPFVMTTKGSGKIIVVINAGGDMVGDITLTGTSVDRNTKAQTGSDTSVITLTGVTTDGSTTDANGNVVHIFTKAYITDKWFTGVVTITTADTAITDMDIFHVSFEQFNDAPNIVINTLDANIFVSGASAEFDCYLHTLHVTGDEVDVHNEAELHVGTVGGATAQAALANKYFRLRQGNLNEALDGTTDGFWVDVQYKGTPIAVEDVTIKVWATRTMPLILN